MDRPPNPLVPLLFGVLACTGLAVALVSGTSVGGLAVGLALALIGAGLAVTSWRRSRPLAAAPPARHWWKLLVAGAAILTAFAVVTTATKELPDGLWWPAMAVLLASVVLLLSGAVLGVVRLSGGRQRG